MKSKSFIFILSLLISLCANAASVNPLSFSFDGQLTDVADVAVTNSNVVLNVKIYNPAQTCLLYEEEQTLNLSSSNGHFHLDIGSAVGNAKRQSQDPGLSMKTIFNNSGAVVRSAGSNCASGYTAAANDKRMLVVTVVSIDGTTYNNVLSAQAIESVPFAMTADNLQGREPADFLNINSSMQVTQANVETVFNDPDLMTLLAGTNTMYMSKPANQGTTLPTYSGNPSGAATGQIWYDTGTNQVKFHNGTSSQVLGGGAPSGAAGGDLGGTYPNPSVQKIQGVSVSGTAPSANQVLKYNGSTMYVPTNILLADIRSSVTPATSIFPASPCTIAQTLQWQSPSDTFTCVNIGLNWSQITAGKPTTLAGYGITDAVDSGTLGTAAFLDTGTTANKIVQLDGSGRLPALDGSQLTNLPPGGGFLNSNTSISPLVTENGKIFALGNTATDVDVTLPTASGNAGLQYQFIRKGTKKVTIKPNGAETVNGALGKILYSTYSAISIVSDGSQWLVLSQLGSIINYSLNELGILDTAFDGDGYINRDAMAGYSTSNDSVFAADLDSNGKILVVGHAYSGINDDIYLARFNSDGSIDTTFGGGDGIATYDSSGWDYGRALAIDASNNIYVVGSIDNGSNYDVAVLKFDNTGVLDTSFSGDGVVQYDSVFFGGAVPYYDNGYEIKIDSIGKIVVTGTFHLSDSPWENDLFVMRLNNNGTLDTSFNSVGFLIHNGGFGSNGYPIPDGIAIDASNNVYICGSVDTGSNTDLLVMKFTSSGTLDSSFSGDGIFTHNGAAGGSGYDMCHGIIIGSSGKLFMTGESYSGSDSDMVIWKLNADGTLDTSYSGDGVATIHANGWDIGWDIKQDGSGNILVAGNMSVPGNQDDMAIWRFTPAGNLDSTFGMGAGYVTHHNAAGGNQWDYGRAICLSNGIISVGTSRNMNGNDDLVIWKYQ